MTWETAADLDKALREKGLPISGCAVGVPTVHETQFGAIFVPCQGKYVRIDWHRKPTLEEEKQAIAVAKRGYQDPGEPIKSKTEIYPVDVPPSPGRKITEVTAFYLYPRAWVSARPTKTDNGLKLVSIFDEVYRQTLESGITVKILRFGLFIFDFSKSELKTRNETEFSSIDNISTLQLQRISILNAYLLCLYTAIFRQMNYAMDKMLLEPLDTIAANGIDDPYHIYTPLRVSDSELPRFDQLRDEFFTHAAGGDLLHYNTQLKWQQEDFLRVLISKDVIETSLDLLSSILKHPAEHVLLLLEMFAHACKDHEDSNFAFALVTCWTIAERLLQVQWNRFIKFLETQEVDLQGKKIQLVDKSRRDRLKDHRSFTSAVMAEILAFNNNIPFTTYELLSKVRSARNAWVHELKSVSREQSHLAINLVEVMLRETEAIDLAVPVVDKLVIQT